MTTLHHNNHTINFIQIPPPPKVGLDVDDNKWGAKPNQIGKTSSKGGNHLEIMEPKRRGQQQSCSFCFSLSLSLTHTHNVPYLMLNTHLSVKWATSTSTISSLLVWTSKALLLFMLFCVFFEVVQQNEELSCMFLHCVVSLIK